MSEKRMHADAVIFDKDGTLIDFDAFWVSLSVTAIGAVLRELGEEEALCGEIMEAFGVENGETDLNSVLCKGTYAQMAQLVHGVLARHGSSASPEIVEALMLKAYSDHAAAGEVRATCGDLRGVLTILRNQGKKLAVITTDNRPVTLFCLEKLGVADLFDRICDYVRGHFTENISLKTLAAEFQVTPETIRRQFLYADAGITPGRLIQQLRIQLAAELLQHTPEGIGFIARQCGYSDPFTFSRAFKNAMGHSPRMHRQLLQK